MFIPKKYDVHTQYVYPKSPLPAVVVTISQTFEAPKSHGAIRRTRSDDTLIVSQTVLKTKTGDDT